MIETGEQHGFSGSDVGTDDILEPAPGAIPHGPTVGLL